MDSENGNELNNQKKGSVLAEEIMMTIENVSRKQIFQKRLIVLIVLVSYFIYIQSFSISVLFMNPVFHCEGLEGKIKEDRACQMLEHCTIINKETLTNELGLYCDSKKSDRIMLQSSVGVGHWAGIITVGLIGDRSGKKIVFCGGLLLLNLTWIFQLIGVYTENITLLLIGELNSGFCHKLIYINFLVLLTRFMKKELYEAGTLGWLLCAHGFSEITISILNSTFQSWKVLISVYSIGIFCCTIASLILLKEDPLFLFETGDVDRTKEIIRQIGQKNEESQSLIEENMRRIDELAERQKQRTNSSTVESNFSLKQIARWDIIVRIIIIGLVGCSYEMASKSIKLSIQNLKYSFNFNLLTVGISNVIGFGTAFSVIKLENQRKRGLIFTSFLYAVIAMLFLFPFCTQSGIIETFVVVFLRILLCWSCNFFTRLKVDSFPEKYQSTIIGTIAFIINFGVLASPIIVQKSVEKDIPPIVTVAIIRLFIGTFPLFPLQEGRIVLENSKQPIKQKQEN